MNKKFKTAVISGAMIGALSFAATPAYAGWFDFDDDLDAEKVATVKIDMVQALQTVQRQSTGRVVSAELEEDDDKLVYEIEIMRGSKIMEVKVDAFTGAIIEREED